MSIALEQEVTVPKFMFDSLKSSHESLKHRYEMLEDMVAELKGKLEQKDIRETQDKSRIAQLEKDYLAYRNTLRQEQSIIYHPKIQQTRDRVILCKLLALEAIKKPDENGFFEFNSEEAIKGAHISKGAFFDGMASLEKYGIVERDHENYTTTDKRICRVKLNPAVKEDIANCVKEVKSNYGGDRATQCPECSRERIKKTRKKATVCQCLDCKHQWVEDESEKVIVEPPVTAQDYAERDSEPAQNEEFTSEEMNEHLNTLFPEEEKPEPSDTVSSGTDENKPPRPHPLCHPGAGWTYDELIEKWFCEVCNHG